MLALLLVPIAVVLTTACGFAGGSALHLTIHQREMFFAGVTCLGAGEIAVIPLLLSRGASQLGVAQAALVGTMAHLFVCVVAAAAITYSKLASPQPYLFWVLGYYWMTLIALVIAFIRAMRAAPSAAKQATGT